MYTRSGWPQLEGLRSQRGNNLSEQGAGGACRGRGVGLAESVSDPISSYIVGACTCAETMALNGYINICIL